MLKGQKFMHTLHLVLFMSILRLMSAILKGSGNFVSDSETKFWI